MTAVPVRGKPNVMPRVCFRTALVVAALMTAACSGDEPQGRGDDELGELQDDDVTHLGRVHVVIQTRGDLLSERGEDGQLDIRARFVEARGLDPELVRSRADLWPLPEDLISAGHCVPSEQLSGFVPLDADTAPNYELTLLDAGQVRLLVGEHPIDVPMVLTPDLVPSMHGVEYAYTNESPSEWLRRADDVDIEVEGSGDEVLPGFRHRARLPLRLGLSARPAALAADLIDLRWQPGGGNPIVHIASSDGDVTCNLHDTGVYRLDLQDLGLDAAPVLEISASRTLASTFEVGDFDSGEVFVELRESARIDRW